MFVYKKERNNAAAVHSKSVEKFNKKFPDGSIIEWEDNQKKPKIELTPVKKAKKPVMAPNPVLGKPHGSKKRKTNYKAPAIFKMLEQPDQIPDSMSSKPLTSRRTTRR